MLVWFKCSILKFPVDCFNFGLCTSTSLLNRGDLVVNNMDRGVAVVVTVVVVATVVVVVVYGQVMFTFRGFFGAS